MFFIKKCIYSIARPLRHVFGLSFAEGIFPEQFKLAKVVPIYKGGDSRIADNYRPISLINNFSKIIEQIMCLRLTAFLESNALISHFQFGFRKSHSTLHPIIHFQNFITQAFNNTVRNMLSPFSAICGKHLTLSHILSCYKKLASCA